MVSQRREASLVLTGLLLLVITGRSASGSREEATPLRYALHSGETLSDVSERFQVPLSQIERLNPDSATSESGVLTLRGPVNRQEAIEILEEARHAESRGGFGQLRAEVLFQEILQSASLLGAATGTEVLPEPIEIPSDVVAQALLGWGRIHEVRDKSKSRWAYEQVETFFPDLEEFATAAQNRLKALEDPESLSIADPPPTAFHWFPESPHLLIDLDTRRLESQLPDISLYQGLQRLEGSEEPELVELIEEIHKRDERIVRVLGQLESLHLGAWIDPKLFGEDPELAMNEMTKMMVGRLREGPEAFARNLDLGDPITHVEGYDVWKFENDTYLALGGEWGLLGGEGTLRAAVGGAESRSHPRLENPNGAYQRMRREAGSGDSLFAFVDLEGFLEGPALEFARNVSLKDKEGFVFSLLVSGMLGINSIQGLALGVDFEAGTLSADLALAHGARGIFALIQTGPCESTLPLFVPFDLEGFLALQPSCRSLLEPFSGLVNGDWLGTAQPALAAQYRNAVADFGRELGSTFDPLVLLQNGFGEEFGLGFRMVEGPLPFPNWILASPIGDASSLLPALENLLTKHLEVSFSEGEVEGHAYRHGTVPGIPLYIDLALTGLEGTLLVATHPTLLEDAIRARRSGKTLAENPDYRGLRTSLPTPNIGQIYLSSTFNGKLAAYGSSGLGQALIHESHPALRTIVKSTLAQVAADPGTSGLGILIAEDRIHASLRVDDFRSWLVTALCVAGGRRPLDERSDSGQGSATRQGQPGAAQSDVSRANEP